MEPQITETIIKPAADYWAILERLIPLAFVGGIVAMFTHLNKIAQEKTWARRMFLCASTVASGSVGGSVAVLGLSLFLPNAGGDVHIAVASIGGAAGQKIFDTYGRRIFGWRERTEDKPSPPDSEPGTEQ